MAIFVNRLLAIDNGCVDSVELLLIDNAVLKNRASIREIEFGILTAGLSTLIMSYLPFFRHVYDGENYDHHAETKHQHFFSARLTYCHTVLKKPVSVS